MADIDTDEFLRLSRQRGLDGAAFKQFVRIVRSMEFKVDLYHARLLLKTYSEAPDYGSQEDVNGTLSTAKPEVRIIAILEELPRLLEEGWSWALDLVVHEARDNPEALREIARRQPKDVRRAYETVVKSEEFGYEDWRALL